MELETCISLVVYGKRYPIHTQTAYIGDALQLKDMTPEQFAASLKEDMAGAWNSMEKNRAFKAVVETETKRLTAAKKSE